MTTIVKIEIEVLDVLREGRCEGKLFFLPERQLDRKLYTKVNKALTALGGKWNRFKKAHVFEHCTSDVLAEVLNDGQYVDQKKSLQFFETPEPVALEMIKLAGCLDRKCKVLEPSAGRGAIVRHLSGGHEVTCFDIHTDFVQHLKANFSLKEARTVDFLTVSPEPMFDVVLMNPPFSKSQDVKHVLHAFNFLREGGRLVAIVSPGFDFRETSFHREFRRLIKAQNAALNVLPAGTFQASGTNVETVMVCIEK